MDGEDVCLDLAHHTPGTHIDHHHHHPLHHSSQLHFNSVLPRDKLCNGMFRHRHHRYGLVSGQPERSVVPAGVVTHVIEVAKQEGHRVESVDTGPGHT